MQKRPLRILESPSGVSDFPLYDDLVDSCLHPHDSSSPLIDESYLPCRILHEDFAVQAPSGVRCRHTQIAPITPVRSNITEYKRRNSSAIGQNNDPPSSTNTLWIFSRQFPSRITYKERKEHCVRMTNQKGNTIWLLFKRAAPFCVLVILNIVFWFYVVTVVRVMRATKRVGESWLAVVQEPPPLEAIKIRQYKGKDYSYQQLRKSTYIQRRHHQPPPIHSLSFQKALKFKLEPLEEVDYNYYTIRINTFKRNEQLLLTLDHYSQCEGVAEIHVIWCDEENDPPLAIERHHSNKVYIERHGFDSLNERFNMLRRPPTLGILSVDDDVLRACEALDSGRSYM